MIDWRRFAALALVVAVPGFIAACGGDGSSDTGRMTLSMTDGPVDGAEAVVLTVASATLQGVQGSADQGPFAVDDQFDLLSYQGTDSRVLLVDVGVAAGTYKLRLDVDLGFEAADPASPKSYIAFALDSEPCMDAPAGVYTDAAGGTCRYPLRIPSGAQAGFRPKGDLVVTADLTSSFTVEFDLRKNMVDPRDSRIEYVLKPTGLRLVADEDAGVIRGTVDPDFLEETCPAESAKVYLYDLADTSGEFIPDDIHDGNTAYVTSVAVEEVPGDGTTSYRYTIGFVEPGTAYAVALTCEDDTEADDELQFVAGASGIEVTAGSTTVRDLLEPEDALAP